MPLDTLALIPAPPTPKVYSYTRWSTPEQAKGDLLRRQTEAAANWAAMQGYELDQSLAITDQGKSAYRGGNATDGGLGTFLEACRQGLIDEGSFLIVESLDRISRMPPLRALRLFGDITESGVTIVTLNDGQQYNAQRFLSDPTAAMLALMVAIRSHEESRTKGRRVAAAWAEKRRRVRAGLEGRLTCRGPSWLIPSSDGGWRFDEGKVAAVQRIYAMTLAGAGEHLIAKTFNEEKVPVLSRGKLWHRSTVSKVLRNPAVIGTLLPGHIEFPEGRRIHVREEPVPGAFPAVVSEAEWLAVRAMKDGSVAATRGRHATSGVAHVLAGLAKCPACRGAMTRVMKGNVAKGGRPKLVCSAAKNRAGCRYLGVPVQAVEDAFFHHWQSLCATVPAGDDALDNHVSTLRATLSGTEDLLEDLTEVLERSPSAAGLSRIAKLEASLRLYREELQEAEQRQAMRDRGLIHARLGDLAALLEPESPGESEVREHLEAGPNVTAINSALRVMFSGVTVDYRTGYLTFHWRQGGKSAIVYAWVESTAPHLNGQPRQQEAT